jgi:hypothetical protein
VLGLGDLGWLQFQRLCALVLAAEAGIDPVRWEGSADRRRRLVSLESLQICGRRLPGPVLVRCLWLRAGEHDRARRLKAAAARLELEVAGPEPLLSLLTFVNLTAEECADPEVQHLLGDRLKHVVLAEPQLLDAIGRHAELRIRLPSVLSLGDARGRLDAAALERSTLDVEAALALAPVFVPTAAYERALATLREHAFLVLTGPPEMGKTAISRMLGLALLADGWEAHECTRPEQVWERFDPGRRQVFVADDAFGSTEYRPDAAERWARDLDRILGATDAHHWLIWTSRPAPLRAGLRRLHRERGGERFPQPAEVQVDAAALTAEEKTLILFRHARAAGLAEPQRRLVRDHGPEIVAHAHFTPERIRRFVAGRLRELAPGGDVAGAVAAELAEPTRAMAASYAALGHEHQELLLAMLDCPPGPVAERELAAALRRHASSGLPRAPVDLVDRLTDHFVRVLP